MEEKNLKVNEFVFGEQPGEMAIFVNDVVHQYNQTRGKERGVAFKNVCIGGLPMPNDPRQRRIEGADAVLALCEVEPGRNGVIIEERINVLAEWGRTGDWRAFPPRVTLSAPCVLCSTADAYRPYCIVGALNDETRQSAIDFLRVHNVRKVYVAAAPDEVATSRHADAVAFRAAITRFLRDIMDASEGMAPAAAYEWLVGKPISPDDYYR